MAFDGKYQVTITYNEGKIDGTLTLKQTGDSFEGSLVTGDHQSDFKHGNINDDQKIAWNMVVKTPYVTYETDCSAQVTGDVIKGEIRTKTSGFFGLEGKKIG